MARLGANAGRSAARPAWRRPPLGPLGGDRRPARVEAQGALIRALLEETPDITIEELRMALAERGRRFGFGTIQRVFRRRAIVRHWSEDNGERITRKKDRPR